MSSKACQDKGTWGRHPSLLLKMIVKEVDDAFIYHNDHTHAVGQGDDCSEMMARIVIDEKAAI